MLGLPDIVTACLFDVDGVLTKTAAVHAAAWKETFDDYPRWRAQARGEPFVPFDLMHDYADSVDGKPRYDGVRSFLAARGIKLPQGTTQDPPNAETIDRLRNRKNEAVLRLIHQQEVQPYAGSVRYVEAARRAGLRRAVVSSSTNCRDLLFAARILDLFDRIVDGHVAGVEAGRRGAFALVVGVDRAGQAGVLREHGAEIVVGDLDELLEAR